MGVELAMRCSLEGAAWEEAFGEAWDDAAAWREVAAAAIGELTPMAWSGNERAAAILAAMRAALDEYLEE